MNGFRSDVQQLSDRAMEFEVHSDTARRILRDLRAVLDETEDCWGADEIGRGFAETHRPGADEALRALESTSQRLREMGTKLADVARTYRQVDESAAARLDQVRGQAEQE